MSSTSSSPAASLAAQARRAAAECARAAEAAAEAAQGAAQIAVRRKAKRRRRRARRRRHRAYSYTDKDTQRVRFPCSAVAKICGLTSFPPQDGELLALVLEYLYQDLPHVLARDAANLGMTVVSEEEELRRVIAKVAATPDRAALSPGRVARAGAAAAHVPAALALRSSLDAVVARERAKGTLAAGEARGLRSALARRVNTSFGTRHEDAALRAYAARLGPRWRVAGSNDRLYVWPFPPPPAPAAGGGANGANGAGAGAGGVDVDVVLPENAAAGLPVYTVDVSGRGTPARPAPPNADRSDGAAEPDAKRQRVIDLLPRPSPSSFSAAL